MATEPAADPALGPGLVLDHVHTLVLVAPDGAPAGPGPLRALLFRGGSEGAAALAPQPPPITRLDPSGSRPVPVLAAAGWEAPTGPAVALLDLGWAAPTALAAKLPDGECELPLPGGWAPVPGGPQVKG